MNDRLFCSRQICIDEQLTWFNPNWTGEVKVDLANFDLKLQENLVSTVKAGNFVIGG